MELEQGLTLVETIVNAHAGRSLTPHEIEILIAAWNEETYDAVAERIYLSDGYVRTVAAELWKLLSDACQAKVTKTTVRRVLEQQAQINSLPYPPSSADTRAPAPQDTTAPAKHINWEFAPTHAYCYGRDRELALLNQWFIDDGIQLVALLGMGGIGKSTLAVELGHRLQDRFDVVVWRSLLNAPPLLELLQSMVRDLNPPDPTQGSSSLTLDGLMTQMLKHLQNYRCLIILDNAETLFQAGTQAGCYRSGYELYAQLWQRLGKTNHQSCVLVTSREYPKEIAQLEGIAPVRSLALSGLAEGAGRRIFATFGSFSATDAEWQTLVNYYQGNPLLLELTARHVTDVFDGRVSTFLNAGSPIFYDLSDLLDWHFQRLSDTEQEVVYWLAINREPVAFEELQADVRSPFAKQQLSATLQSLKRKFPLTSYQGHFSLQPVLLEYVTNRLIECVCEDIGDDGENIGGDRWHYLQQFALLKATAKAYVREAQRRVILRPVLEHLAMDTESFNQLADRLINIIVQMRQRQPPAGYGAGNLINLLRHLKFDFKGCDFSHLTFWQADFQGMELLNVDFSYSHFTQSVFTEAFDDIHKIAVSPDGKRMASSHSNGQIRCYELPSATLQRVILAHENWALALGFNADGTILFSGGDDGILNQWDMTTGDCLKRFIPSSSYSIWNLVVHPQDTWVAISGHNKNISVLDCQTGRCLKTLYGHTGSVFSICLSQDGDFLISGSNDGTVRIWNTQTWQCTKVLEEHSGPVRGVAAISGHAIPGHTSSQLASGSFDNTIKLWNVDTGDCIETLPQSSPVWTVAFSNDGQWLTSGNLDGTVNLWHRETRTYRHSQQLHQGQVNVVAFNPENTLLISGGSDQALKIWDVKSFRCLHTIQGHIAGVTTVVFSSDSKWLAGSSLENVIRIWDRDTGVCSRVLQGHQYWLFALECSADDKTLVSGSINGTIRIWDLEPEQCRQVLPNAHKGEIWSIAISPDDRLFASASGDQSVKLWELETGKCLAQLHGHQASVMAVAFSPTEPLFATAGDLTIRLWHADSAECLAVLERHQAEVFGIQFSQDGTRLISCGMDGNVYIWEVETRHCVQNLSIPGEGFISIAISPDQKCLIAGTQSSKVYVFHLASGACIRVIDGFDMMVRSLAWSPDGQSFATNSAGKQFGLWSAETGTLIQPFAIPRPYEGMNISDASGLSAAERRSLKTLGAIENP
ncbi:MAG: NB-ARC domain-containing protein [Cyanobacteria bacterium P01_F01_bin.150]